MPEKKREKKKKNWSQHTGILAPRKKAVSDGCVLQNSVQKRELSVQEYWMFEAKDYVWLA